MTVCRICSTVAEHKLYAVREMQLGTREEFVYFECRNCRCLQVRDIPANLAKHYPDHYGPFSPLCSNQDAFLERVAKRYAKRKIVNHRLGNKSLAGKLFENTFGFGFIPYWLLKKGLKLSSDSKILDVGCGSGATLNQLRNLGFRHLLGIDAFVPSGITHANGIIVLKARLESIDDCFDFIMLHHSFEHMAEPLQTLRKLNSLLKPEQYLLIRIPICSSYAWQHYGVNWCQIDAPRHLFLHSIESMALLAGQAGFEISEIVYDSIGHQFMVSEQYAKDIPLYRGGSYVDAAELFSKEEVEFYCAKAQELNQQKLGDQACFYLRKRTS